jgi:hypothetical protein
VSLFDDDAASRMLQIQYKQVLVPKNDGDGKQEFVSDVKMATGVHSWAAASYCSSSIFHSQKSKTIKPWKNNYKNK